MNTYSCFVCKKEFQRFSSQVKNPNTCCCSVQCTAEKFKTTLKGKNNPNYKEGSYIDKTCICGNQKDTRATFCAICSHKSSPINKLRISDSEVIAAIKSSSTFLEASKKIKISRNYIRKLAEKLNIDISHLNKCCNRLYTSKEVLIDSTQINLGRVQYNNQLVRRVIFRENLLQYSCKICNQLPIWNGIELVLELDHINGNPKDNRLENLRFLCPNCHTQQPTSRGKKTIYMKNINKEKEIVRGNKEL